MICVWAIPSLNLFNETILAIEIIKATPPEVTTELEKLRTNIQERLESRFLPQEAKKLIQEKWERLIGLTVIDEFHRDLEKHLNFVTVTTDTQLLDVETLPGQT